MNKIIKELLEEAGVKYITAPDNTVYEKFAELIVEKCVTTILTESKWYWDKDEFDSSNAVQNAARRVKEYFGVKE